MAGIRFDDFELDVEAGELRRHGRHVKIQDQPLQVLIALVDKPRQVVSREELCRLLWGPDTIVDREHGLGTAVRKLRAALGDSAKDPRYIETVARHGFRFIAPLKEGNSATSTVGSAPSYAHRWKLAAVLVLASTLVATWAVRSREAVDEQRFETLAVLPLENLSGDPEQQYLADGLTEALISTLAQIRGLGVISRSSVLQYVDVKRPLPEIAGELGADVVVEGSVLGTGDRIRITARLIDGTQAVIFGAEPSSASSATC